MNYTHQTIAWPAISHTYTDNAIGVIALLVFVAVILMCARKMYKDARRAERQANVNLRYEITGRK